MTAVVKAESLTKRFGEVSAVTDLFSGHGSVMCVGGWDDHGLSRPEWRWQDDDAADDPGADGACERPSTGVRSSLRGVAACGVAAAQRLISMTQDLEAENVVRNGVQDIGVEACDAPAAACRQCEKCDG